MRYCYQGKHETWALIESSESGEYRGYSCLRCGAELQLVTSHTFSEYKDGDFSESFDNVPEADKADK